MILATSVMGFVGNGLLILLVFAVLGLIFAALFKSNRLFFWALTAALGAHLFIAGALYGIGKLGKPGDQERRVKLAFFRPAPPVKVPEPPKPKLPDKLPDLPFGAATGKRNVKEPPKGRHDATKVGGATSGQSSPANPGRPMVSSIADSGDVPVDIKDDGLFNSSFKDVIDASDIRNLGTGSGGDGLGDPNGTGSGDMPLGFKDGKRGGRVYFVRLKHGSGAWSAHAEGTRRLMAFLNQYFPCETDSWPMTAAEMRDRYMNKGAQPTFLYIYCDETFSLSASEVQILRIYMERGGFLFMDSRPDPLIKDLVANEIAKVLPGSHLAPLPKNHPINSFLFALSSPGVGENLIDQKNYGIAKDGRLIIFYTMGNFSHLYASVGPNADDYYKAQYQMGANVMLYAIRKGNKADIMQRAGAKAEVTNQAVERLMSLGSAPSAPAQGEPGKPPESIKIKNPTPEGGGDNNTTPGEQGPEDIKLNDN